MIRPQRVMTWWQHVCRLVLSLLVIAIVVGFSLSCWYGLLYLIAH